MWSGKLKTTKEKFMDNWEESAKGKGKEEPLAKEAENAVTVDKAQHQLLSRVSSSAHLF